MSAKKSVSIKKGKAVNSEINITPLIDVVLVLLIIFMVITPILIHEMSVNLPDNSVEVPQDDIPQDQLVAAIYEDGSVALNLKMVSMEELHDQVSRRLRGKNPKVVFVDAHPDTEYARVIEVIDAVRDAGADKVGLASLKDEGPARPSAAPVEGAPVEGAAPPAP